MWQIFPKQFEKLIKFTLSKHYQNFPKFPNFFFEKMTKLAWEKKKTPTRYESSQHPLSIQ
jgi:hypothetical protein